MSGVRRLTEDGAGLRVRCPHVAHVAEAMDERLEAIQRQAAADPRVIGLAGGLPNEAQFPRRALARSFLRALRQAGAPALQYGWAEGSERLRTLRGRAAAGARRARSRPATCSSPAAPSRRSPSRSTWSASRAIGCGSIRRRTRRRSICSGRAACGPWPAPAVGRRQGRLCDAGGRQSARRGAAGRCPARLAGVALARHRRRRLRRSAVRWCGAAAAPGRRRRRACCTSARLSKTLCPGLRIGWLVAPRRLRRRAVLLKQGGDLQASSLGQAIAEDYLTGGAGTAGIDFDARLLRLRRFYRRRAGILARALRTHLPEWRFTAPEGGFAIWVEANGRVDELALMQSALAGGVCFDPGSAFRPDRAGHPAAARLCFSLAPSDQLEEGVRRLAVAWKRAVTGAGGSTPPAPSKRPGDRRG